MILKPKFQDFLNIGHYLGHFSQIMALFMLVPLVTSLVFGEWNSVLDFFIGILISLIIGLGLRTFCHARDDFSRFQAMSVAAMAWIVGMMLGSLPYYLSGYFKSYLDACFDVMSGFTTCGLTLIQNADHLSNGINMWRHLTMFLGGQGIIVLGLTFLISGFAGAYRLYLGEGRDERILPNVIQTARFIWQVNFIYLILGTFALTIVGVFLGQPLVRAFLHGTWIFMAAFSTGGFAPQTQNVLYYHSVAYEIVAMIVLAIGMMNFAFHYVLWTGNWREVYKNIEIKTIFTTILVSLFITGWGLIRAGTFKTFFAFFRFNFFQVLSAHTTTGFMTAYTTQLLPQWGALATVGLTVAMGLGGCACSTAGGFKALRVGIIFKAIWQDIKSMLVSENAVLVEKFHHVKETILTDKLVRSVMVIVLSYLAIYFIGALVGVAYGYNFLESLFESVSAAANAGLSCGITSFTMPALLKITYIIEMWAGRLEFLAVYVLGGLLLAMIKGK
jgi:trk system potassium uptake protein TrkH